MTVQTEQPTTAEGGVVPRSEQAPQTYTVLVVDESNFWREIATVTVPPRSKRRTILAAALAEAEIKPEVGGGTLTFRVLDEDSARPIQAAPKLRDPEWEIGTA